MPGQARHEGITQFLTKFPFFLATEGRPGNSTSHKESLVASSSRPKSREKVNYLKKFYEL
ncbi:hypothetical protein ID47_01780 [Candidatus Paracaedibacter acanthamoebae]|uniref:Uncharacterized protein n=1 Tax=Candidatus Odyssella acanthamoebae TaxID=91604 RepID=A0A077ATL5_9PROT|nr:hypothetical protein ID47_01780 [Candidatus Paracaedibacter acanthamoebae]